MTPVEAIRLAGRTALMGDIAPSIREAVIANRKAVLTVWTATRLTIRAFIETQRLALMILFGALTFLCFACGRPLSGVLSLLVTYIISEIPALSEAAKSSRTTFSTKEGGEL